MVFRYKDVFELSYNKNDHFRILLFPLHAFSENMQTDML